MTTDWSYPVVTRLAVSERLAPYWRRSRRIEFGSLSKPASRKGRRVRLRTAEHHAGHAKAE
jgi:hypothetical protein